jgi:hypothetical protein
MTRKTRARLEATGVLPTPSKTSAPALDIHKIVDGPFLTVKDLAARLSCSPKQALRLSKKMRVLQIGSEARIPYASYLEFVEANLTRPGAGSRSGSQLWQS